MIVGVDEVGRGSWAGPICVAAVAWPLKTRIKGLNDSKLVPADKRPALAKAIRKKAHGIGIGWVSAALVDKIGVTAALKFAATQAVAALNVEYDQIIIDGNIRLVNDPRAITKVKADMTVPAVMAASIVAKVARDSYMRSIAGIYHQYSFATHVGYGTKKHQSLLKQFGPCAIHRFSYAPVKELAAYLLTNLSTKSESAPISD